MFVYLHTTVKPTLLSSHGACDLHRHESAMAAEKEGGLKEAQLAQQRHEKAISELQVPIFLTGFWC